MVSSTKLVFLLVQLALMFCEFPCQPEVRFVPLTGRPICGLLDDVDTWATAGNVTVQNETCDYRQLVIQSPDITIWRFNLTACKQQQQATDDDGFYCEFNTERSVYTFRINQTGELRLSEKRLTAVLEYSCPNENSLTEDLGTLPRVYESARFSYEISGLTEGKVELLQEQTSSVTSTSLIAAEEELTFCAVNLLEQLSLEVDGEALVHRRDGAEACVSTTISLATGTVEMSYYEENYCRRGGAFSLDIEHTSTLWKYLLGVGIAAALAVLVWICWYFIKRDRKEVKTWREWVTLSKTWTDAPVSVTVEDTEYSEEEDDDDTSEPGFFDVLPSFRRGSENSESKKS